MAFVKCSIIHPTTSFSKPKTKAEPLLCSVIEHQVPPCSPSHLTEKVFLSTKTFTDLTILSATATVKSNLAVARRFEAINRFNFKLSALFKDLLRSTNNCCCMDNEVPILVTGPYDDPRIPVVLEMPIADSLNRWYFYKAIKHGSSDFYSLDCWGLSQRQAESFFWVGKFGVWVREGRLGKWLHLACFSAFGERAMTMFLTRTSFLINI